MRGLSVVAGVLLAGAVVPAAQVVQQSQRFDDRIDVKRIVIDVRVLDGAGNAMPGLGVGDFDVDVDGRPARVDSVIWTGTALSRASQRVSGSRTDNQDHPATTRRLIVFLIQKDLQAIRMRGLLRMLIQSRRFLDALTASDRVAILSFDSHLKLWSDFTNDRERLQKILSRDVLFEAPPALESVSSGSLFAGLDAATARRTYGIEKALQLIAGALGPLPGAKSIVLLGYGIGRFGAGGVTMEPEYESARRALVTARTAVFSLDTTDADMHSLEVGLQLVSQDSGGFFARTHVNPALAMKRLAGALAGSYALFVEASETDRTTHEIRVRLTRQRGTVLAKTRY